MRTKTCGIYRITHVPSKTVYIGQSVDCEKRMNKHRYNLNKGNHRNQHLQRAWILYGSGEFLFEILEECEQSQLTQLEQKHVDDSLEENVRLYNIQLQCVDSPLGLKRSPETGAKISAAKKGRTFTPEHRAKLAEARKNRVTLDSTRQKLSASGKRRKMSEETRAKMSESAKQRIYSQEELEKLRQPRSEETKQKMREGWRKRNQPL